MRAPAEHVISGRLLAPESDERGRQVSAAVTRADIRSIFADLPEPHPDLNGRRR